MGLFNRKTAARLDATATAAHQAGTRIAGKAGGKVADAIVNATLAPARRRIDVGCTCGKADCPA